MIGIITIFAAPALKIFAIAIMYRLTGALIQPLADKRLTDCVRGMAESMNYVAGIAALTAVLMIISISVIIKTIV
jgi:stage III sporulation protein AE